MRQYSKQASRITAFKTELSSSDDSIERRSIMLDAVENPGESCERVTYYGDGLWDQEAADILGKGNCSGRREIRENCSVQQMPLSPMSPSLSQGQTAPVGRGSMKI